MSACEWVSDSIRKRQTRSVRVTEIYVIATIINKLGCVSLVVWLVGRERKKRALSSFLAFPFSHFHNITMCVCACFKHSPGWAGWRVWRKTKSTSRVKTLPSKNLKQFGDSVVALLLINKLEKDVVDGASDKGAQVEEFAVDPVKGRL